MLAFVERIGRRTYKHTTLVEHTRKPLIQAAFKRRNGNGPAVENMGFYRAFNPIPTGGSGHLFPALPMLNRWQDGGYTTRAPMQNARDNGSFRTFRLQVTTRLF